jgi:lipoprotein-releasing system permease protein
MFEVSIAIRYLLTRKKERFISIINTFAMVGISLGVATLIIVMSVMNGYEVELIKRILGVQSHITITAPEHNLSSYKDGMLSEELTNKSLSSQKNYHNLLNKLYEDELILYAAPVVEGQAMVIANNNVAGAIVKGMRAEDIEKKPIMSGALKEGDWLALSNNNESKDKAGNDEEGDNNKQPKHFNNNAIIGVMMAENLGVGVGDEIRVIVPQVSHTIVGEIPRTKVLRVAGIFDVGMAEYNGLLVFLPLESAQILLQKQSMISHIEIVANSIHSIDIVKKNLFSIIPNDWIITDWQSNNQGFIQALKVERNVMFLILSLIILIAAFNIVSSLMILVKDKQKSIAILRTMGAAKSSIVGIFVFCGFAIGLVGTVVGSVLGILFATNIEHVRHLLEGLMGVALFDPMIYFLTTLPSDVCSTQVIWVILLSLCLSLVVTIYPALRISRISPAQVLRHE